MDKHLLSINRLMLAAMLFLGLGAIAQTAGFNQTYIVLSVNGGADTYYDLNASTANPDFQGANLGTFCQGSTTGLRFKGGEHNVWKCGGCDLTSTRLYYRIYLTSGSGGSFVSNTLPFANGSNNGCGGADQMWANTSFNTNLLSGLAPGNYTFEVYSDASVTCSGGTVYASNGGANYKATFTVSGNVTYYLDNDGDGYGNPGVSQVSCGAAPAGYVANNTDCNDNNASVFTASTIYVDNDQDLYDNGSLLICHGLTPPNGFSFTTNGPDCNDNNAAVFQSANLYIDADGDHYDNGTQTLCYGATVPAGYSSFTNGSDCNDSDGDAYQMSILYVDNDGDGFNDGNSMEVCHGATIPPGYTDEDIDIDCDDNLLLYVDNDGDGFGSNVYSACDGVENNSDCDDEDPEVGGGSITYYADVDGDGFGDPSNTTTGCEQPAGYVTNSLDCDDNQTLYEDLDGDGFGSNVKVACNGVTNNSDCNDNQTLYADLDADGFGSNVKVACDGVTNNSDCDDNMLTYADADGDGFGSSVLAACGVANSEDCDDNALHYQDLDGDGFGSSVLVACGVTNNSDCDDNLWTYADEDGDGFGSNVNVACGVSNSDDCNDSELQYEDLDNDGLGSDTLVACGVSNSDDCDDNNPESTLTAFYQDLDGDSFGNASVSVMACTQPDGYVSNNTDCDDTNASVYHSGSLYVDADGDGFNNGTTQIVCYGASIPSGYTLTDGGLDCNDSSATAYPGATEILGNGIDDNCDGNIDEGGPQVFTQILESQCGATLASISTLIGAVTKSHVTSYRFRVTNLTTSQEQILTKTVPHFQLTSLASYDYATTYSIEVELQIDGIWVGSYGPACNVSTPAILAEGGAAAVTPSQCGATIPSLSTLIATTSLPGVKGYRFRVTNTLTNEVQVIDRTLHWFSLTMLASFNYGTTYAVEVAVKTNGNFSGFGAPCFVSTPEVPTLVDCGIAAPHQYANIATQSLNRVTTYRFEFTNLNDFTQVSIDRQYHWFTFSNVPDYEPGATYAVRVALMTAGSWSPYGEACLVTAPGAARGIQTVKGETAPEIAFRAVAYPNPYQESFALDMDTAGDEAVRVKVYDMIGKLVEEREFAVDQIEMQQFGERYPSGVYNVIVTQGQSVKTLRVIKR